MQVIAVYCEGKVDSSIFYLFVHTFLYEKRGTPSRVFFQILLATRLLLLSPNELSFTSFFHIHVIFH